MASMLMLRSGWAPCSSSRTQWVWTMASWLRREAIRRELGPEGDSTPVGLVIGTRKGRPRPPDNSRSAYGPVALVRSLRSRP
jgi:hypothetical protein